MTTVTISMQRLGLDGSLHKQTMDFLDKLAADPTSPGLHVEPVQASVDPRVRTGRVNKQYRAVMFEMTGPDMHHFVIVGVYNHDDAYAKATGIRLEVNPINGIPGSSRRRRQRSLVRKIALTGRKRRPLLGKQPSCLPSKPRKRPPRLKRSRLPARRCLGRVTPPTCSSRNWAWTRR